MMGDASLNEIEMQEKNSVPETLLGLEITDKEKELLRLATAGQLDAVKQILHQDPPAVDVNCRDALGRTPLMLAAENRQVNEQMVELLVLNGADTESALLFAVRQGNLQALRNILQCRLKTEAIPNQKSSPKDLGYITPLMLASKLGNYQMVTLLISHGEEVLEHHVKCSCVHCSSAETNIARSLIRLESYKALSNPVYIAAQFMLNQDSAKDPILTAFVLSKKLRRQIASDYEFKDEYLSLCEVLNDFPVNLLSECQNIEEVQMVMETKGQREEQEEPAIPDEARYLKILDLAIENKNEKFIAHPLSQLMLNYEVYRKYPQLKDTSLLIKYLMSLLLTAIFPMWTFCYLFLPNSHVTRLMRTPLLKYAVFIGSYHVFLVLVSFTVFQSREDFLKFSINDWLVLVYVIGYWLDIGKEIYRGGRKRYFSNWYNFVLVAMVTSFSLYYIIWTASYVILKNMYLDSASPDPSKVKPFSDAILLSYVFYSFGILLSFLYFLSIFHFIPTLGPLLMSLLTMLHDVANFFIFFIFLFMAFLFSLSKLYWQYIQAVNNKQFAAVYNSTHLEIHQLIGLSGSFKIVFWSLFGRLELEDFKTEPGFNIINNAGLAIFGLFNILAVLVALNMLIAMLNESFSQDAAATDTKWKYSRTKMLFSLIYKSNVLPPPLNLIPTPRAVLWLFKAISSKVCCRNDECCTVQYFNKNRKTNRGQLQHRKHRELIGRLVLRHLSSAERSKNSTAFTVEDLDRASQSLSSGLTSQGLSSDMTRPSPTATQVVDHEAAGTKC